MLHTIIRIFRHKIDGGALQYTIVFSLLIVMSLSLFLMFVRITSLEVISSQKQTQLIENINSAILILENKPQMFDKHSYRLHLLDDTTYINNIEISEWGFYSKVKITSKNRHQQLAKVFLFSDNIKGNEPVPSLYFSGPNQYLTVGGKTYLGNNTFLPAHGIRRSYVNGIGYKRDSLIQGKSHRAAKILPSLNKKWEERYKNLKNTIDQYSYPVNFKEVQKDSLIVSFHDEPLLIKFPDHYTFEDMYLDGNIIISGRKIRISKTCQIHNCLFVADTILVDNQFRGNAQLFAKHYLEVGDSSALMMPSILYLDNLKNTNRILIKSNTLVQGDIIVPHPVREPNELLIIEENCKMIGQIYCNGYSSFEGCLFGSFYTKGFIMRNQNGQSENYLLDICIDSQRLPDEYCGISLINKSNGKRCAEEIH